MSDPRRRKCKDCGRSDELVGELSWNGLCPDCGPGRVKLNNTQLRAGRGPLYEHWRSRLVGKLLSELVDEGSASP